ncbi:MAG: Fic family protein [Terracidiphilus sp.]
MDTKQFTPAMTGSLLTIPTGKPDAMLAFIPNPLPPTWEWPERLWKLLMEARTAIASLDGTGKHLPTPEILLRPLQNREAQLSSKLEGTITDPQNQALFQADPRYPVSESDPANAYREVFNYGRALRSRLESGVGLPLSLRLIRDLHKILMDGVRGSGQTPGEFRTTQNQIGRPARFVPPPPVHMLSALYEFEKYLYAEDDFNPLVRAFLAHYQFETIHPFGDGNGRVGRLLLSLTIAEWCKLSGQWLYMSAYFERNKTDYMDYLLSVSTHGNWEGWIEFCLEGVVSQANDAEKRCDKLLSLHKEFHRRLEKGSLRLAKIVEDLFESPVISVLHIKRKFNVSHPTARADLKKLASMGILYELSDMERITYYCPEVYRVTYEDLI